MPRLSLFVLSLAVACWPLAAQAKGPILDKILFDAKTQEDVGLKEVAGGQSDLWNYATAGAAFKALPEGLKSKLDVYGVTGVSYVSLLFNPYPNQAPYVVKGGAGRPDRFNPFAVREIRYAFNYLIDRQKVVDEIMVGCGSPMYLPVIPGQPNSARYGALAGAFGFSPGGNAKKALDDIEAAMRKAADLPANRGKLLRRGAWWTYDGQDVTVKFLIRVDDPNLRLPEGRYIASLIEKAGFRVERLEYDRSKCLRIYRQGDPKDYQWNLYTEAFNGGGTSAYFEGPIAQMYAPWYANMPGCGVADYWNYGQPTLDRLTQAVVNGQIASADDYWSKLVESCRIGVDEAVRVFVAAQTVYYVANKGRFNARMAYGMGDGVNKWSLYTADVKPDAAGPDKGLKVLRLSSFSAKGVLFTSPWDPIGNGGFSDSYSGGIIRECSDGAMGTHPANGGVLPVTASYQGLRNEYRLTPAGEIEGLVAVPPDALLWNARSRRWEGGLNYVDLKKDGSAFGYVRPAANRAYASATFTFKFGAWHHGRKMDIDDYRYAQAVPFDFCVKKGADDRVYEPEYASSVNPSQTRIKGMVFHPDGRMTVYGDVNFPMDPAFVAAGLCPSLGVQASNYGSVVPWEIVEALIGIVAEPNASKTAYSYNSNASFTEVDLISRKCVADLRAKLLEFIQRRHVPDCLKGFVSPERAARNYRLAVDFIDKHGHAYISNGGFYLDRYDAASNSGALLAFRDPAYPFAPGYWTAALQSRTCRIDLVSVGWYEPGRDLPVAVRLSELAYPSGVASAPAAATVRVSLAGEPGLAAAARQTAPGLFEAALPADRLKRLKPGNYAVVVEAALGRESPSVETSNVIVY